MMYLGLTHVAQQQLSFAYICPPALVSAEIVERRRTWANSKGLAT